MPRGLWSQEWLNQNSQRSYPLAATAARVDRSGALALPDDVLLALYLPVHAGLAVDPARFYLQAVTVTGAGVSVTVGYDDGSDAPPAVATAAAALDGHAEYAAYALSGTGDFDDVAGKVVLGAPAALRALPPGRYVFDLDGGRLDPDCVRPYLRGVSALVLANGAEESERLTGDVVLTAGANVRLVVTRGAGRDPEVRVDAIKGEGLTADCGCETGVGPPVRTINGVGPDADGNVALAGNDCLTVTAGTNQVTLADVCAKPCCGCPELAALVETDRRFAEAAARLDAFVGRLDAETSQMQLTVLGSRLGDRGCVECDPETT